MSYYSVITVYPDHVSTVEFSTIREAVTEFNYRKAIVSSIDPENITVRLMRVSPNRLLDITPNQEDNN